MDSIPRPSTPSSDTAGSFPQPLFPLKPQMEPVDSFLAITPFKETPAQTPKRPATSLASGGKTYPASVTKVPTGPSIGRHPAVVRKPLAKAKGRAAPYTTPTRAAGKKSDALAKRESLKRLLLVNDDLMLWLEHTRYFDEQHRAKVLDGVKQLKAIDDERNRLLSRFQDDTGIALDPTTTPSSVRGRGAPASDERQRSGGTCYRPQSPLSRNHRRLSRSRSRSPPRYRSPYPARRPSHPRSASQPRDDLFHSVRDRGYDLPMRSICKPRYTRDHIDTDGKGNTRYFLVKSFNEDNVLKCQNDGIWITQVHNGQLFAEAFRACLNVILIFSVNQSRAFQGYARISSPPSPSIPRPSWVGNIQFPTSHPLRVEWINTGHTPYRWVGDIKNPLNEDAPVILGRDGQEYSEECGRALLNAIDSAHRGGLWR